MTTVRIPPTLRAEAGGEREVAAHGETVREVLEQVGERYPALGSRIWENGDVAEYVNVYLDGEDVRTLGGLETRVREGSSLILLPAMAGGDVSACLAPGHVRVPGTGTRPRWR
jgi:molybdopterin converting factor small subunit